MDQNFNSPNNNKPNLNKDTNYYHNNGAPNTNPFNSPNNNNPFNTPNYYAPPGKTPGYNFSVASVCCGIVSLLCCWFIGIPSIVLGILAIVFYFKSKKLDNNQANGMAVGGLVCGIIGLILGVLTLSFTIWCIYVDSVSSYYYWL